MASYVRSFGPQGTSRFQGIQEAYEILSNPEKRKLYNHNLEQDEIKTHSRPEPIFRPDPVHINRWLAQFDPHQLLLVLFLPLTRPSYLPNGPFAVLWLLALRKAHLSMLI
jgi:hypothetical protein